MEEATQRIWRLACGIYAGKSLGKEWCATESFPGFAAKRTYQNQCEHRFIGLDQHQSTSGWHGRVKKSGKQSIGRSRGGWNTKLHLVAASDRNVVAFSLSPGQAGDAPEGRELLRSLGAVDASTFLLMDRAYEGDETRLLAVELGYLPVVPPKRNRLSPWKYDRELYKRRNKVDRLFRRIKRFRRIFTRYDKLDIIFISFLCLAFIYDSLM